MGRLWEFISGPAGDLIGKVGGVIDDLVTSDEERLEVKRALVALEYDFQKSVMDADVGFAREQSKVLQVEMSGNTLQRSWRPILMLTFGAVVIYSFVIGPMFGLPTVVPIPERFWNLLSIGIGGYVFGRSAEKIIPNSKWGKE